MTMLLAQQLIDAGRRPGGALAFVAFTGMCVLIVGALFFMDRVRRRAEEKRDQN
jgi:hypothetical protein